MDLCGRVQQCKLCDRMADSARVLGAASGSIKAKLMFIGEAPGRLGADVTGIPFHGDKAGDNFERLLDFARISREDIFVTNAVLCNPKNSDGNNTTPNEPEIARCANFLREQIHLIKPSFVVTLGLTALKATALIENHDLILREHVRTSTSWYGRFLIPLYHPGQRAMIHRSMTNQRSDYQFVAESLRRIGIAPRRVRGRTSASVREAAHAILLAQGEVTYFALHKLLYLLECLYMKEQGERLTGAYFIRQKDGPYCTDLHLSKLKSTFPDLKVRKNGHNLYIALPDPGLYSRQGSRNRSELSLFIQSKAKDFKGMSDSVLKTRAYLTKPFKVILRQEKNKGINMFNTPIQIEINKALEV